MHNEEFSFELEFERLDCFVALAVVAAEVHSDLVTDVVNIALKLNFCATACGAQAEEATNFGVETLGQLGARQVWRGQSLDPDGVVAAVTGNFQIFAQPVRRAHRCELANNLVRNLTLHQEVLRHLTLLWHRFHIIN